MKMLFASPKILLSLLLLPLFVCQVNAQVVPALESIQSQAELDKAISSLDSALFDAYNRCDLEKFSSFLADDVEFYHDQGGVTLGKQKLTESVKNNICGKVTRQLVPGTLQHRGVGEASFIHLWQYKDGAWKITRVISYDHHAAAK